MRYIARFSERVADIEKHVFLLQKAKGIMPEAV